MRTTPRDKGASIHRPPSNSIQIVFDDDEKKKPAPRQKSFTELIQRKFSQSISRLSAHDDSVHQIDARLYRQQYESYKQKYHRMKQQCNDLEGELKRFEANHSIAMEAKRWSVSTRKRRLIVLMFISLIAVVFIDSYVMHSTNAFHHFTLCTLAFMGIHLLLEHVLEEVLILIGIKSRIYENTSCVREIINDCIILCLFLWCDSYAIMWRPIMWGSYVCDLIMLCKKWNYVTSGWLIFIFCHHFSVGVFLIVLDHAVLGDYHTNIQICIVLFLTSNTFGVLTTIWKTFKCCKHSVYPYCAIVTFVLQRIHRCTVFVYAFYTIQIHMFFMPPTNYIFLFAFGLTMDCVDIYFQLRSILRFRCK